MDFYDKHDPSGPSVSWERGNVTMDFIRNHNVTIQHQVYVDKCGVWRIRVVAKPIIKIFMPWL